MAVPSITSLSSSSGQSGGLDLVSIVGADFATSVEVEFGGELAEVYRIRPASGAERAIDVFTPYHDAGLVDVVVRNLDGAGDPVPGEETTEVDAYTFQRFTIAAEDNLAILVRTLIRDLKRSVLGNVNYTVSVDWDYQSDDEIDPPAEVIIIDAASTPSLTITGPSFGEARDSTTNETREVVVDGPTGPELRLLREPYVVDLLFGLVGLSKLSFQLLNLMQAVASHFHRYKFVDVPRDVNDSSAGVVQFEVDAIDDYRARLNGRKDDLRTFTSSFRVRGFWLDGEATAVDQTVEVLTEEVSASYI